MNEDVDKLNAKRDADKKAFQELTIAAMNEGSRARSAALAMEHDDTIRSDASGDEVLDMAERAKQDGEQVKAKIAKQKRKAPAAGSSTPVSGASPVSSPAKLFPVSAYCLRASQNWYLKGLVPLSGLAQIFGQSGAGKSFIAFDLAYSLAIGRSWFGWKFSDKARQALPFVVYCVLEGQDGFAKRVKALTIREAKRQGIPNPIPDNFMAWETPLDITNRGDREELVNTILAAAGGRNIVLFLDTQGQASPALDENSSESMGKLFDAVEEVQRALSCPKCMLFLIAHAGKVVDVKNGARGWSGQKAVLELMLAVEKPTTQGGFHKLTLAKSKDAGDGDVRSFILQTVVVGKDDDGDDETSCTVEPCEKTNTLTPDEQRAIESLRKAYAGAGIEVGGRIANTAWVEQYAGDVNTDKVTAKHAIRNIATNLAEKKILLMDKEKHRVFVRLIEQVLKDFQSRVENPDAGES